ncbi:hypothetical protein HAV15_012846 [Penicillium sp. str. |nr:hypothetical protein HAV15_012846 [Penicillium sp. str. \
MTALPPPKTKAKTKTLINFRHSRNFRREANGYLIGLKGFHSIFLPHSGSIEVEIETRDLILSLPLVEPLPVHGLWGETLLRR